MRDFLANFTWLLTRWYLWVPFLIGIIVIWWLFKQRVYKIVFGKLFVRHGKLGRWVDIEEHLQQDHPKDWVELQKKDQK